MQGNNPQKILDKVIKLAIKSGVHSVINDDRIRKNIETVCQIQHASVRLLMSCLLGKMVDPKVDPRKPYTEIKSDDCFSGRTLDEQFLSRFITEHQLPCRSTTAFLTPAFRTKNQPLTQDIKLESRFPQLIEATLQLLDDVAVNRISAKEVFVEVVRNLLLIRNEALSIRESLLRNLRSDSGKVPLSAHDIFVLIKQHLMCKHASRLPVLIVAAAYDVVGQYFGERVKTLNAHNSADLQTGALGDLEICLENDEAIVTAYEMKMKRITKHEIDLALEKVIRAPNKIHNYVFITTETIDEEVSSYVHEIYHKTGGIEITVLDCLGFLEHFLSLFHRFRHEFIEAYQKLVLAQSDTDVSETLKNAFLTLRTNAESTLSDEQTQN